MFGLHGLLGVAWSVVFYHHGYSSPARHPTISADEYDLIDRGLEPPACVHSVPWLTVVTSGPVWAVIVAFMAYNFMSYALLTCLPKYMKDVLGMDVVASGTLSALPYLITSVVRPCPFGLLQPTQL